MWSLITFLVAGVANPHLAVYGEFQRAQAQVMSAASLGLLGLGAITALAHATQTSLG